MAYEIGFTDNTGTTGYAHREFLLRVKALAELNGWVTLRYDTSVATNHELILKGEGLSGTEEIFVGIRCYELNTSDYYNFEVATFTGYVPGVAWSSQPGRYSNSTCGHNNRIDYWLVVNAQRIAAGMKVGTPVYEHFYIGKFFPFAKPAQYPYPVCCIGTLGGAANGTRFSSLADTHSFGYRGLSHGSSQQLAFQFRGLGGSYTSVKPWPFCDNMELFAVSQTNFARESNGYYPLLPIQIVPTTSNDIMGELDGIYATSGFNNAVENTYVVGGVTYVVIQDIHRTGFKDYIAMRLD